MHKIDLDWFKSKAFYGSLGKAKAFLNKNPECNDDVEFINAIVDTDTLLRKATDLLYENIRDSIDRETED